jgi:hypothetical protein
VKGMKYIASCSGGKDSVTTLIIAKEKKLPLDEVVYCEVMFDDETSGEMPEHRDFIYNRLKPFVETEIQVPFVIVRSEKTYLTHFEAIVKNKDIVRGYPIPGMCGINRDCKIPPIKKYWKQTGEDVVQYVGIAYDEPIRFERLKGTNKVSLLEKYKINEKQCFDISRSYDLLSPIYEFSCRNGCWFCMNCNDKQWRHLIKNHPKLFNRLIDLENKYPIRYRECLTRNETAAQIKERIHREGEQLTFFD